MLPKHAAPITPNRSGVLPSRAADNLFWLGRYIEFERIGSTLDRITRRLTRGRQFKGAIGEVEKNYADLEKDFLAFFPDLIEFSNRAKQELRGNTG
jgi:acyl carrier protein phosphodiesterase